MLSRLKRCCTAARAARPPRRARAAGSSPDRRAWPVRHRIDVAGGTRRPVTPSSSSSPLPPTAVATTGSAARHRLEDRVRDALGRATAARSVEPAQHLRHVVALAGQPGRDSAPPSLQHLLDLRPQRPVAGHHEPHPLARDWIEFERAHERAREQHLVLDRLQPADGADQPQRRSRERRAGDRARGPPSAARSGAVSTPL